jgi:hypothetical protein
LNSLVQAGYGPNSGSYYASTGCVGAQCIGSDSLSTTAYLDQDLTTVAGASYTIEFFFASGGEPGQELLATFGGTTLFDLVNLPLQSSSETEYIATAVATGTVTRVEFRCLQNQIGFEDHVFQGAQFGAVRCHYLNDRATDKK